MRLTRRCQAAWAGWASNREASPAPTLGAFARGGLRRLAQAKRGAPKGYFRFAIQ